VSSKPGAGHNGQAGNKTPSTMVFNVFETGDVSVYFDAQKESGQFKLFDADIEKYKGVILSFVERLIFPDKDDLESAIIKLRHYPKPARGFCERAGS
jgi:hypothetical protein